MYQKQLSIHLIGSDAPQLADTLRGVASPERFSLQFDCFSTLESASSANGDILILCSGASDDDLAYLARLLQSRPLTRAVLCADGDRLTALTKPQLETLSAIWTLPLTETLARFHFSALLDTLKTRKEYWLYRNYLDSAINSIPDLIWFKDAAGAHLKVNQSFCQVVKKTPQQIEGRGHYYIWDIPEEEYKRGEYICMESETETMEKGCTCLFDENVKTPDGMRHFKTYKTPIFDEDGSTVLGTVGIARDVTDLHNMNNELKIIINGMSQYVIVCNKDWTILNINKSCTTLFGGRANHAVGRNYLSVKRFLKNITPGKRPDVYEAELRVGKRKLLLEFQEHPIIDVFGNVTGYLCIFNDITQNRAYETEIIRIANTDMLTGLSSRRHFFATVAEHPEGIPTTLFYMDVDNFKSINDLYGHPFGDTVLSTAANCIRQVFPDGLNVRLGGDEFVTALWSPVDRDRLAECAQQLQDLIQTQIAQLTNGSVSISICIGIACATGPDCTLKELMHQGDLAMYAAKHHGKARWHFYSPEMDGNTNSFSS